MKLTKAMIHNLVRIFKVKNFFQLLIVFLVFGITGSLSVVLGEYVLFFFLKDKLEENFFYWFLRVILIFPLYQILLIIVGTIFGEFDYFWKFTKKILKRLNII
ncbi:MAG: hypothetical protein CFH30_01231 [Alphaproteobacteria bacterium MarineAlpha8_Bin1]|nr:MAG: hypothetical protein CFH30_01231 [Alphaproteobacteria bacterium MarineAlpha8_Bin1]|tara:strand:+ start:134 stop:442 length:309 start_codon:yes stop_codon:yes gene_type:complete